MSEETKDLYDASEDAEDPSDSDEVEADEADSPEDLTGTSAEHDADGTLASQKASDVAEAESLTVTAKLHQRQQLEDELARFLAQGGKITEVPPDESAVH
jgi:hypothetical protein